ncbi:MAG: EF-hand domain-containing protein [Bacteroidota bacterium]
MISEFQKQKFAHLFNLLDVKKNGHLQLGDFTSVAQTLRKKMNLKEFSSHYKQLCDSCEALFEALRTDIALPKKRTMALEEWLEFFEKCVDGEQGEEIVEKYRQLIYSFLFDVFDDNNDGYISKEEYAEVYQIYGIDDAEIEEAFESIDVFVDDRLSKYELINAIEVFLTSNDPKDRGNLIFGRVA